jgi:hypothetical protein
VRGEIVFYLRHRAGIHTAEAKHLKLKGDKMDQYARAQELNLIAQQLEDVKIV